MSDGAARLVCETVTYVRRLTLVRERTSELSSSLLWLMVFVPSLIPMSYDSGRLHTLRRRRHRPYLPAADWLKISAREITV
jgi:hypothetical protein